MINDTDHFLRHIWQQKTVYLPQALPSLVDIIDGNELAGLACEELAEARIISGYELNNNWQCRQGPFTEQDFASLPSTQWSLLVQGVDQWLEEIRDVLQHFDFLPQWRLEDIMASYAPTDGGVGPHFDYYDVFLIQVSGQRQWHIGQHCDEQTPLQDNHQVKLLKQFETQATHTTQPGDVLYIPAGTAHWGTATSDDCITLSVGFRAPSEKELLSTVLENMLEELSENTRYRDTAGSIASHPHEINGVAQQQLSTFLTKLKPENLQQSIAQAFGQLVTEPRHSALEEDNEDTIEPWTTETLEGITKEEGSLTFAQPPHSRLAFSEGRLFVNGESYNTDTEFSRQLCAGNITLALSNHQLALLVTLLERGDIALE